MKLSHDHINAFIEERYRKRGEAYFHEGMVEIISRSANSVKAKCAGTRVYSTQLELKNNKLTGTCSCPAVDEFGPCKHMAALAYASMHKNYAPSEEFEWRVEDCERLEKHLKKKSKADLIMLLMQIIQDDDMLKWSIEREMEE